MNRMQVDFEKDEENDHIGTRSSPTRKNKTWMIVVEVV
jgi:hypothetical protein